MKLFLIHRLLAFRREHERLLADGDYQPLRVSGARREHLCAFARRHEGETAIALAPRLLFSLTEGAARLPLGDRVWGETVVSLDVLAAGGYRDVITGAQLEVTEAARELRVGAALRSFPVALLVRV